jgi:hypothetical protein
MPPIPSSEATNRVYMHLEDDLLMKSLSECSNVLRMSQSIRVKAPTEGGGDAWYWEKRNKEIDLFSLPLLVLRVLRARRENNVLDPGTFKRSVNGAG